MAAALPGAKAMLTTATEAADAVLHRLLATPEGRADPYPLYRKLRTIAPVHRSGLDDAWYVSRFEDCRQLLLDPRCGRKPIGLVRGYATDERAFERFAENVRSSMLTEDPPEHTRLRAMVAGFFSPRRVRGFNARIQELVDQCLAAMDGACDAMSVLAVPVALGVAADLVGIPAEDRRYCLDLLEAGAVADRPDPSSEQIDAAQASFDAQLAYFRQLIAWRRKAPGDDVLSALVAAGGMDVEDLVDMAVLLFLGGLLPTANLIGNGLFALLRHPGELARLRSRPQLVPAAVEEMLRYDPPVQGNGRTVHDWIEVAGQRLAPGDLVVTLIGGANRDPERFSDPERFDVGRRDNQPLAFGAGMHHCLGAGLARLEAQAVFATLATRPLTIELTNQDPPRHSSLDQRGFVSLPVQVNR
jgi:cytochrome P450